MSIVTADLLREKLGKVKVNVKVVPPNAAGFALWKAQQVFAAMSDGQLLGEYARFRVEEVEK